MKVIEAIAVIETLRDVALEGTIKEHDVRVIDTYKEQVEALNLAALAMKALL